MNSVRVGMISPYSFTLPGGVQMQALYLARALRRRGVSVSLLGPCDGPPPEPDIIPIGNSLFIAANGSFAPIAFDIPAFQRSYAVLRDQRFDVLHVHEPLVPAPSWRPWSPSGRPSWPRSTPPGARPPTKTCPGAALGVQPS